MHVAPLLLAVECRRFQNETQKVGKIQRGQKQKPHSELSRQAKKKGPFRRLRKFEDVQKLVTSSPTKKTTAILSCGEQKKDTDMVCFKTPHLQEIIKIRSLPLRLRVTNIFHNFLDVKGAARTLQYWECNLEALSSTLPTGY